MKKTLFALSVVIIFITPCISQKVYSTKTGEISFYSKAPIEDIDAHNKNVGVVLNTATNEIGCVVLINLFDFEKDKMEKDFQRDYLETDKYANATFEGSLNEKIDYNKDGTYPVTITGKLKIHGVEQTRTEKGTLIIHGETISLRSNFKVAVKDFHVKIPRLLRKNIAEVVDVAFKADLTYEEKIISKQE